MAGGLPQLQDIVKEFTRKVYQPGYDNYSTLIHIGNTDGWVKALMTLCNPGEGILAAEWTYPSALSAMIPFGIKPISMPMDSQGIRSDKLRSLLSEWDKYERNMPRPHVMYTIPVGQNPTGVTTEAARKKEIYDICVEFDIIIVEDDPYYFLQQGPYVRPEERIHDHISFTSDEDYIAQLAPSYLRFDYQGRVIRLDSFSKTVAPGCRMGWFTCNSIFAERLERQSETSTQAPCGFGQSLVTALMLEWGHEGYIRWLRALRLQYKERRDFFVDCLHKEFHVEHEIILSGASEGCNGYLVFDRPMVSPSDGYEKYYPDARSKAMFSFVPPTSGMFIWIKLHLDQHPSLKELGTAGLEMKLWELLAEAGVLFGPGSMFGADNEVNGSESIGHFRISFSNAEAKDMEQAIVIFATVLRKFFKNI
ncbi:pyridoxal phosphate-dependent transferase [Collybia nuda]|uniref:Pyridoxal phosphate-dependent transferase n=1 Tax=Collybia nuda TaxID=64659 RepID=A0A9P6CHS5_9AGAR|nr:pyridoxal phosphate-dependent transferase [Collybia nuda]